MVDRNLVPVDSVDFQGNTPLQHAGSSPSPPSPPFFSHLTPLLPSLPPLSSPQIYIIYIYFIYIIAFAAQILTAKTLLGLGANPNHVNVKHNTALHIVASVGPSASHYKKAVHVGNLLLFTGARVSVRDEYGNTPLHIAASVGLYIYIYIYIYIMT